MSAVVFSKGSFNDIPEALVPATTVLVTVALMTVGVTPGAGYGTFLNLF